MPEKKERTTGEKILLTFLAIGGAVGAFLGIRRLVEGAPPGVEPDINVNSITWN